MNAGFWLARRGMVALNLAITDTDCDAFLSALGEFIGRYGDQIGDDRVSEDNGSFSTADGRK